MKTKVTIVGAKKRIIAAAAAAAVELVHGSRDVDPAIWLLHT